MVPFKISATFLFFIVYNLLINIVHGTPTDLELRNIMDADYLECLRQIKFAYGEDFSATGCFRYAVEHYKKGKYIPGTPGQKQQFENDNTYAQFFDRQTSGKQEEYHGVDFSDDNTYPQFFDGQTSGKQEEYHGVDFSDIPNVDNFSGLQAFMEADPQFQQMSNEQNDIHRYGPNYAMEYYKVLETLVQGCNVPTLSQFCKENFNGSVDCLKSLKKVGKSKLDFITVAFSDLILSQCKYEYDHYVYSFVEYIKDNVKIVSPSKMPKKFCIEIYNKSLWYMQMKGYHIN